MDYFFKSIDECENTTISRLTLILIFFLGFLLIYLYNKFTETQKSVPKITDKDYAKIDSECRDFFLSKN